MPSISTMTNRVLPDFKKFSEFVMQNQKQMTPMEFSKQLGEVQRGYRIAKQRELFCQEADKLADKLVESENGDFAGIIYSAITKLTEFFPKELEIYAQKGAKVAEANGDYLHLMSRLNNLRKVYIDRYDQLYNYINTLYAQERCLKKITGSYDTITQQYKTVTRKAAPKETYENMLACVRTELAKLIWKKHPHQAEQKFLEARKIFEQKGQQQSLEYIDFMLTKIRSLPTY